jgi:hypothetical protein
LGRLLAEEMRLGVGLRGSFSFSVFCLVVCIFVLHMHSRVY